MLKNIQNFVKFQFFCNSTKSNSDRITGKKLITLTNTIKYRHLNYLSNFKCSYTSTRQALLLTMGWRRFEPSGQRRLTPHRLRSQDFHSRQTSPSRQPQVLRGESPNRGEREQSAYHVSLRQKQEERRQKQVRAGQLRPTHTEADFSPHWTEFDDSNGQWNQWLLG